MPVRAPHKVHTYGAHRARLGQPCRACSCGCQERRTETSASSTSFCRPSGGAVQRVIGHRLPNGTLSKYALAAEHRLFLVLSCQRQREMVPNAAASSLFVPTPIPLHTVVESPTAATPAATTFAAHVLRADLWCLLLMHGRHIVSQLRNRQHPPSALCSSCEELILRRFARTLKKGRRNCIKIPSELILRWL